MILTHDTIFEEIKKGNIQVDPMNEEQIGPASIDLRLGSLFRRFKNHSKIFLVTEDSPFETITEPVELKQGEELLIQPAETVLGITEEKITLAPELAGWIEGRSRFARIGLGVHITSGFIQPGISNYQVLEITNLGPTSLALRPGLLICQVVVERCEGSAEYKGVFQGQEAP